MTENIFLLMNRGQEEQTCPSLPTQVRSAPVDEAKYQGEQSYLLKQYPVWSMLQN